MITYQWKEDAKMICENCGSKFDEPVTVYENAGEHFGYPAREPWAACPCCRSTDISSEGVYFE